MYASLKTWTLIHQGDRPHYVTLGLGPEMFDGEKFLRHPLITLASRACKKPSFSIQLSYRQST